MRAWSSGCVGAALVVVACSTTYGEDSPPPSGPDDAGPDVAPAIDAAGPVDPGPREAGLPDADAGPPCDVPGSRGCDERYVFVTSTLVPGDFGKGGGAFVYADALCTAEANLHPLYPDLHGRQWRAWLCTSAVGAATRTATAEARWIRPDRQVVFPSRAAIRNERPLVALGGPSSTVDTTVWTGCSARGTTADLHCQGWSSTAGSGTFGDPLSVSATWSSLGEQRCEVQAAIYCFEESP